jgi:hypothetical protein
MQLEELIAGVSLVKKTRKLMPKPKSKPKPKAIQLRDLHAPATYLRRRKRNPGITNVTSRPKKG